MLGSVGNLDDRQEADDNTSAAALIRPISSFPALNRGSFMSFNGLTFSPKTKMRC